MQERVDMFQQESINVPVLGIIENMAYFTPEELPENKYYIFGQQGAKLLSEDLGVPSLEKFLLFKAYVKQGILEDLQLYR
jgi:ATP-binding protein involved in chromosome partitioning